MYQPRMSLKNQQTRETEPLGWLIYSILSLHVLLHIMHRSTYVTNYVHDVLALPSMYSLLVVRTSITFYLYQNITLSIVVVSSGKETGINGKSLVCL